MRLVIIDSFAVFYRMCHSFDEDAKDLEFIEGYSELALQWVNSLAFCPQWSAERELYKVLWAVDSKPYWREDFDPDYKGHRSGAPFGMNAILKAFNDLRTANKLVAVSLPRQEADDIAAAVVRLRNELLFQRYYLCTVDSDWQGSIADTRVLWCSLSDHEPRIRARQEVYNWLASKHRQQSVRDQLLWPLPEPEDFTVSQIWDWKSAVGDVSDNLGPGTPSYLINLFEPPPDYDILNNPSQLEGLQMTLKRLVSHTAEPLTNDQEYELGLLGQGYPLPTLSMTGRC